MGAFHYIVAFLVAQRLVELWLANRNARRLIARGGVEHGAAHYPLFVLLHGSWLAVLAIAAPAEIRLDPLLLAGFVLLQLARLWVIWSLGPYWTTRIVTLPDAPLVRRGPYRFMRHPNYLVVIGEMALVPLLGGLVWIAVVYSILNLALLAWRVRIEDRTLAPRRALTAD